MGRKCAVEGCLSDSNRPEDQGVTFHKVPMHSDIRPKWLELCRISDDKRNMKVIYVCSRHFLRADFCNFKGKKYMLRQGVLPSVFPWDKSKLEAIKVKEEVVAVVKTETPDEPVINMKLEVPDAKEEVKDTDSKMQSSDKITFGINQRIEALDFNNVWYPARIVEEDYEENEVLIHFEKYSSKYDEWISMDSPRLRPLKNSPEKRKRSSGAPDSYSVGERCLASWCDTRKFPATVTKVLSNDNYEVLFDDGFVKNLKGHKLCKIDGKPVQSSPLFDPVQGTKEERREKKRKFSSNFAELFKKRSRLDESFEKSTKSGATPSNSEDVPDDEEIYEPWVPQWENGRPVGVESSIESSEGMKKSIIVPDPRLPEGWVKHLSQRVYGASAGKWDTIIVSPDRKRFRSRSEVKNYLEDTKLMKYNWSRFDFSIHRHRSRKKDAEYENKKQNQSQQEEVVEQVETTEQHCEEEDNTNHLKIQMIDDAYQCPIEGCGKSYRKENLAQMHVKHYHPEYTKFLDSTPNVADLAYARTVGERHLDKSPKSVAPKVTKPNNSSSKINQKLPTQPLQGDDVNPQSPVAPVKPNKDSEIIKLLNTKPCEKETIQPLPSGLPSNMYPDIKLKDLLNKSEGIPKRDDINLKALSTTRPPVGIKTLLPVVRQDTKRKREPDSPKGNEPREFISQEPLPPPQQPNNVIIEGGQVIKIVRMKQEEIINCTCGFTEEDGLMIQCDLCLCWQHAFCNNIERESQVPEKYVCYICQNPIRQRLSKKYYHDQDWLKHGNLITATFRHKNNDVLEHRFELLKKSHDVSGGLLEIKDYVNTLRVKLKIAEAKNHPKLYLWSKPWEKLPLPEKVEVKNDGVSPKQEERQNESMLMMILKNSTKDELNLPAAPIIPQPEAAIDSADCRLNLLEHIAHSQNLVDERLDAFEKQINELEDNTSTYDDDEDYSKTRQTLKMLLRDLNTLQELSQLTTL